MIPVSTFKDMRVALFGLGGSGLATARALQAGGADVVADDDNEASRARAASAGIPIGSLRGANWKSFQALVLSPGVPLTHPQPHWCVELAHAHGVEVIGDIELFCRERRRLCPDSDFIAITGTNGKSTTTALIGHILAQAGRNPQIGGNIGTAILELAAPASKVSHVVECSSYQIDLAPSLDPSIGVLLNVTPDHIDRHGTLEHYAQVKERLVAASKIAVVGVDDAICRAVAERIESRGRRLERISTGEPVARGIRFEAPSLVEIGADSQTEIADLTGIGSLRGAHNGQNAAAAFAVCRAAGLTRQQIVDGLRSFPGLAHRMEEIGRIGHVLFVNDSKATNAEAAERALSSFERIYWLAGGRMKEGGVSSLVRYGPKIAKAFLFGEAEETFGRTLRGHCPVMACGTLADAMAAAFEDARADACLEPVVLLSPACASFDQFPNFEVRGDAFRAVFHKLSATAAPSGGAS